MTEKERNLTLFVTGPKSHVARHHRTATFVKIDKDGKLSKVERPTVRKRKMVIKKTVGK